MEQKKDAIIQNLFKAVENADCNAAYNLIQDNPGLDLLNSSLSVQHGAHPKKTLPLAQYVASCIEYGIGKKDTEKRAILMDFLNILIKMENFNLLGKDDEGNTLAHRIAWYFYEPILTAILEKAKCNSSVSLIFFNENVRGETPRTILSSRLKRKSITYSEKRVCYNMIEAIEASKIEEENKKTNALSSRTMETESETKFPPPTRLSYDFRFSVPGTKPIQEGTFQIKYSRSIDERTIDNIMTDLQQLGFNLYFPLDAPGPTSTIYIIVKPNEYRGRELGAFFTSSYEPSGLQLVLLNKQCRDYLKEMLFNTIKDPDMVVAVDNQTLSIVSTAKLEEYFKNNKPVASSPVPIVFQQMNSVESSPEYPKVASYYLQQDPTGCVLTVSYGSSISFKEKDMVINALNELGVGARKNADGNIEVSFPACSYNDPNQQGAFCVLPNPTKEIDDTYLYIRFEGPSARRSFYKIFHDIKGVTKITDINTVIIKGSELLQFNQQKQKDSKAPKVPNPLIYG